MSVSYYGFIVSFLLLCLCLCVCRSVYLFEFERYLSICVAVFFLVVSVSLCSCLSLSFAFSFPCVRLSAKCLPVFLYVSFCLVSLGLFIFLLLSLSFPPGDLNPSKMTEHLCIRAAAPAFETVDFRGTEKII